MDFDTSGAGIVWAWIIMKPPEPWHDFGGFVLMLKPTTYVYGLTVIAPTPAVYKGRWNPLAISSVAANIR